MKRFLAIWLAVSLLLSLAGCGGPEESAHSAAPAPASAPEIPAETEGGYVIPASWHEETRDNTGYGFTTAQSTHTGLENLPENYTEEAGSYYTQDGLTLTRYDLSGNMLCGLTLEPLVSDSAEAEQHEDLLRIRFGDTDLWLLHAVYTVIDTETGETQVETYLEHWSQAGELLARVDFDLPEDDMIVLLELSPAGAPMVGTLNSLMFLDETGSVQSTVDTGGLSYDSCRDKDGRVYLLDHSDDTLYTIDWAANRLGDALFSTNRESVRPGSGPYDFFLVSDDALRGAVLATGTITELLRWEDCGLAGMVRDVTWVDENTIRASGFNLLTDVPMQLDVTRLPEDQVPEKTVLRLVVGVNEFRQSVGANWSDIIDGMLLAAISQFNLSSSQYRIEVDAYSSAEELNLMILSGDAPDIIDWSSTGWLESPASMAIYAKRGYLRDLTPLLAEDPDYSESDFIPNILALSKERTGGFYTLPLSFYFHTFSMSREYVGDNDSWNFSDLLAAAQRAPEGMTLLEYGTQQDMLDMLLSGGMNRFVDLLDGTCDFRNQEFYDLLTVCRDYCPAETGEDYAPPAEGTLLTGEGSLGRLGQFASDVMRPLEEQGRVLIGYPDAGGSGVSIIFNEDMAICALGQQQEGAWEFLRTLLDYDFQYKYSSIMCSVRQDAFHDKEDAYLKYNGSCTPEESQAARELVYEAANCRTNDSPIVPIVLEEAAAFFNGDKTAEAVADIIQNRVEIYLGEQS